MTHQEPAIGTNQPTEHAAIAISGREPEGAAAPEREVAELRAALAVAQARARALEHELQHRVRNMLAVIRSVHRRTRESGADPHEFADHFEGRLDAIARYQSLLDEVDRPGIDLEDMLRDELLTSRCLDGPGCTLSGPPVYLRQKAAELMGLTIHELTTNSIKFGALAHGGRLAVDWSVTATPTTRMLRFRWVETGIPVIASAPRPYGFGRQLIEEALPYQLGATTSFALDAGGLECSILLPLTDDDAFASRDGITLAGPPSLPGANA